MDINIIENESIPEGEVMMINNNQVVATWKGGIHVFDTEAILKKAMDRLKKAREEKKNVCENT